MMNLVYSTTYVDLCYPRFDVQCAFSIETIDCNAAAGTRIQYTSEYQNKRVNFLPTVAVAALSHQQWIYALLHHQMHRTHTHTLTQREMQNSP